MGIDALVLDTDILSEVLKGRDPAVERRKLGYLAEYWQLTFTSVSVMEILAGLHYKSAVAQLRVANELFSGNREIVPTDRDYRLAGEIVGALARRGTPIGASDPLIAACAIHRDLTLATGNTRHFGYVQAAGYPLQIDDWRQG